MTSSSSLSLLSRTLKLSSGAKFPQLGFGTWNIRGNDIEPAMLAALDAGYRHFDFAMIYENEREIGKVLHDWMMRHPEVSRNDFFFTSKLWNTDHRQVRPALEKTLNDLQLEYLDLYLIHWPLPQLANGLIDKDRKLVDTWHDMEAVRAAGLCRHIGVSNFTESQLKSLLGSGAAVPEVHQLEVHPLLPQHAVLNLCRTHHIVVTAYCPLGSTHSPLLTDGDLVAIAHRHRGTVAQVLLTWGIERGYAVIPKSANPERIASNTHALPLSPDDIHSIDALAQKHNVLRVCDPRDFFGVDLFNDGATTGIQVGT